MFLRNIIGFLFDYFIIRQIFLISLYFIPILIFTKLDNWHRLKYIMNDKLPKYNLRLIFIVFNLVFLLFFIFADRFTFHQNRLYELTLNSNIKLKSNVIRTETTNQDNYTLFTNTHIDTYRKDKLETSKNYSNNEYYRKIIKTSDHNYLGLTYFSIIKFDNNFNNIWTITPHLPVEDIIELNQVFYVVSSHGIVTYDELGNRLNNTNIEEIEQLATIGTTQDNEIYMVYYQDQKIKYSIIDPDTLLFKKTIISNLNIINNHYDEAGFMISDVEVLDDGTMIFIGNYRNVNNNSSRIGIVFALSKNGNLIWSKKIDWQKEDHVYLNNILKLNNNQLMIIGRNYDNSNNNSNVIVIQFNKNGLNFTKDYLKMCNDNSYLGETFILNNKMFISQLTYNENKEMVFTVYSLNESQTIGWTIYYWMIDYSIFLTSVMFFGIKKFKSL